MTELAAVIARHPWPHRALKGEEPSWLRKELGSRDSRINLLGLHYVTVF